ncbi:MAG: MFS transporter [Candidatus Acididesulfobacter diazotrophicus]|jgi:MFS family permease|uniref:MFS transporter n=1 Tax=Candidatus Acididesulfobacter diazotrophicus TaxID=2597226 RepID=A0A519BPM1_9DELT|nr:MAG: MFS transporter [Candidatus Acididesulfobacter diazotrophicus]
MPAIFFVFIVILFQRANTMMAQSINPLFVKYVLHTSLIYVGIATAVYAASTLLVRYIVSIRVKPAHITKFIIAGMILFSIAMLGYFFSNSLIEFLLFVVISGFATAIIMPFLLSLVNFVSDKKDIEKNLTIYSLMLSLALVIGPLLGTIMLSVFSIRYIYLLLFVFAVAGLFFAMKINKTAKNKIKEKLRQSDNTADSISDPQHSDNVFINKNLAASKNYTNRNSQSDDNTFINKNSGGINGIEPENKISDNSNNQYNNYNNIKIKQKKDRLIFRLFKNKKFLEVVFYNTVFSICFASIVAFGGVYARNNFQAPYFLITLLFAIFFISSLITRLVLLFFTKKGKIKQKMNIMNISILLSSLSFAAMVLSNNIIFYALALVLLGIPHALIFPVGTMRISEVVEVKQIVAANTIYQSNFDIGGIIGPLFLSYIGEAYSIKFVFFLLAVFLGLAFILGRVFMKLLN